jgi:hypothetical protein
MIIILKFEHGKYSRMKSRVNLDLAEKTYFYRRDYLGTNEEQVNAACDALRDRLHFLNHIKCEKLNEHLNRAVDNTLAACRYHFFAYDGPNYKK